MANSSNPALNSDAAHKAAQRRLALRYIAAEVRSTLRYTSCVLSIAAYLGTLAAWRS